MNNLQQMLYFQLWYSIVNFDKDDLLERYETARTNNKEITYKRRYGFFRIYKTKVILDLSYYYVSRTVWCTVEYDAKINTFIITFINPSTKFRYQCTFSKEFLKKDEDLKIKLKKILKQCLIKISL